MKTRAIHLLVLLLLIPLPLYAQDVPFQATVNKNANLRAGPGTSYAIVGQANKNQTITVVDISADETWYKLNTSQWIAAFLVTIQQSTPVGTSTKTPTPTRTPQPTKTLTPPPTNTPIPGLIAELMGYGDSVEELPKLDAVTLLVIIANSDSRHFAVTSYSAEGEMIDLLVNTTEPYTGMRPIGLSGESPSLLEIKATGLWRIFLFEAKAMRAVKSGEITGKGDDVFAILVPHSKTATIEGNLSSGYFGVTAHQESGRRLLVNTTEPYIGTVIIGTEFMVVEVKASGEWSFTIN